MVPPITHTMLTDRNTSYTNPKTWTSDNTKGQSLLQGQPHKATSSVNDRNCTGRLSLLDRLPLTDTGQEYMGNRSLPLLSNHLSRKGLLALKASSTSISHQGPESGLLDTWQKRHTPFTRAKEARSMKRHPCKPKYSLYEPAVTLQEGKNFPRSTLEASVPPWSVGKYSRHGFTANLAEEEEDAQSDDTTSVTSGKSVTLRPAGGKVGQPGGRKKMGRRRIELESSPQAGGEGRTRRGANNLGLSHIIKFTIQGQAIALFRRSARKVMHVLHWMVVLSKKDEKIESQLKTFFDMAQEIEDSSAMRHIEQQTGISFDPKYYRTSKQRFHLTFELKRCLTLVSDHRTEEMIQRVVTGLQHLEAFAEYPLHMQYKLAQVAWYQELPPRRMIIRQGHKAENFYFILSGTGIAKQLVKDEDTGQVLNRVIARLQKGQSIGEVALVHHQERAATVESVTYMQLLVVSREDFLDIFFSTQDGGEPEHVNFCRHVDFMKDWPVEVITEEPEECLFHYFRRGTVVVQDSRVNDWIYIVKSGTCMVLKKLKSAIPQKMWSPRPNEPSLSFPRLGTAETGPKIDSRTSRKQSIFNIPPAISQEMLAYFQQFQAKSVAESEDVTPPENGEEDQSGRKPTVDFTKPTSPDLTAVTPRSTHVTSVKGGRHVVMTSALERPRPRVTPKPRSIRGVLDAYMKSVETYITRMKEKTVTDGRQPQRPLVWKEPDTDPCFVQLKKLRPRDSFGLEELEFDDEKRYDVSDTSVILVSNGAEMVMISRKFFTKNSNDLVKQFIREKIRPFPSEETLQANLQNKVNWDLYRQHTLNQILTYNYDLKYQKIIDSDNNFLPCV